MKCLVHNLQLPQCCQLEVINGGWVFSQIEGSLPIAGLGKGIKTLCIFKDMLIFSFQEWWMEVVWFSCSAYRFVDGGCISMGIPFHAFTYFTVLFVVGLWSV